MELRVRPHPAATRAGLSPGPWTAEQWPFFGGGGRILRRHTHWLSAAGVIRRHCGLGADGSKAAAHPGRGGSQRPGAPTCEETQSHGREPAVASRTPRRGGRRQFCQRSRRSHEGLDLAGSGGGSGRRGSESPWTAPPPSAHGGAAGRSPTEAACGPQGPERDAVLSGSYG